tara:strand:- start:109 stop:390 length:282 start_codon:yes stop_codon:yes gene_type:complete
MFIILLIYCFYGSISYNLYEGMNTNSEECNERALLMALKNTAAIASINDKIKSLSNLDEKFTKIENKVNINHEGIQNLTNKLSEFTTSLGNKK